MKAADRNDLTAIRRLVGRVVNEQLRHVDCFVSAKTALFMPVSGACYFALTPEHAHPAYMFVLHFNDRTSMKLEGTVLAGEPGRVSALSPDIPHQELLSDSAPRYIAMMIERRFFEKQFRQYAKKAPAFRGESHNADPGLFPVLKRFMIEADSGMPGGAALLDALAVEICHCLIRSIVGIPAPRGGMADRAELCRVIEYLNSHLGDKLTVDRLADVARLSPSHFTRVFREDLGKPPMEYVHELRLERAKKMLLAGDRTVTEIAMDCGFGSPSYLSACFQQTFKMTPREYRKRVR
jgi:AraC family transcriptional regulator